MISSIHRVLILFLFPCLIISCTLSPENEDEQSPTAVEALTDEQQAAFDALNILQMSTFEMSRLYSTFPNIEQPSYPADTSFEISQTQFLSFMEKFIALHYNGISTKQQIYLAETSVLAQQQYTVKYTANEESDISYEDGIPMNGTWVLPNVLERRDIILVW